MKRKKVSWSEYKKLNDNQAMLIPALEAIDAILEGVEINRKIMGDKVADATRDELLKARKKYEKGKGKAK